MAGRHDKTRTQRGVGWRHVQARNALLDRHIDGQPCWWCDLPMFRAAEANYDGRPLAADHELPRSRGGLGTLPTRLLHGRCNGERGDGSRDHLRPAINGGRRLWKDQRNVDERNDIGSPEQRSRFTLMDWWPEVDGAAHTGRGMTPSEPEAGAPTFTNGES